MSASQSSAVIQGARRTPAACEFFISIDEWNRFARSLLVRPVRISEFIGQQSLLDPDPVKENGDQRRQSQEAIQTRGEHRHANEEHDVSQIDWMSREPIDAMCNESMIFLYYQSRRVKPPECALGDEPDCQSNDDKAQSSQISY